MKKRIEQISKSIAYEKEMLDKLVPLENLYKMFHQYERHYVSVCIIKKIIHLKEQINNNYDNLLLNYSTLRYILETLIHARLLQKEESYVFKIYYSIYNHQINKNKNFINRIRHEIELLNKYDLLEEEMRKELPKGNPDSTDEEIKTYITMYDSITKEVDSLAHKELTIFWSDFENNGYAFQKIILEEKILPEYERKLAHLEKLATESSKKVFKNPRLKKLFDFKQHTSVFKLLKDERSWNKRAEEAGLTDEYALVYEMSSSLLHSTSYSLFTSKDTDEQEQFFALDLITKYSTAITDSLKQFLDYDRLSNFNVVNIE